MPPFPKPSLRYEYRPSSQVGALREHKDARAVPEKAADRLLVATWNVANLGVQERREKDYLLIAEIVSWFDLVAMQEVNNDLSGLLAIHQHLPTSYRLLFSDAAGNEERMAFLYDSERIILLEEVGEVGIPPSDISFIRLPGIEQRFDGFDRNPFLAGFRSGSFTFVLVNAHLYFGSDSAISMNRRRLEAYAIARWADLRRVSPYAYLRDIVVLGDFNLPKAQPGDPIYDALTRRGLHLPEHSTKVGSTIGTDNQYDQLAFFPGETQDEFTGNSGVFDFDSVLFRTLWEEHSHEEFFEYMRYYISDHRPLWTQFRA